MIQNYFFRVLKLIVTKEPGNSDEQKWRRKKKKKKKTDAPVTVEFNSESYIT